MEVIYILKKQFRFEVMFLSANLITDVFATILGWSNMIGAEPNNSNSNLIQKVAYISYLVFCAMLLAMNAYVINMFYKMVNFYLTVLN